MTTPTERVQPDPLAHQLSATILASKLGDGPALTPHQLHTALAAALNLAYDTERQALRWEHQMPVPEWVRELRERIAAALDMPA